MGGDEEICSMARTQPICTLQELLQWNENEVSRELIGEKLENYKGRRGNRETLLCHDMRGGYLPEERLEGCVINELTNPYIFFHWWYIDIFVYFSHNFITIPTVGWINQAHQHGVLILGTFITEWKDGEKLCAELFDVETVVNVVMNMVKIAKKYNFDGWLINIENKIKEDCLESLALFLQLLTDEMRFAIGERSRVIWYDSVTVNGELKWQNDLNNNNLRWFNLTNGIFLNYAWEKGNLKNIASRAKQRINDVYVGVDCFGRGCHGGGGWNCYEAFACARENNLSVALFAPGWIAENFLHRDIIMNSLRFWDRLASLVSSHPVITLPVHTKFSVGLFSDNDKTRFKRISGELQPFYLASGFFPQSGAASLILPGPGLHKLTF
ncbi:unnamed protein product [Dracunculus medinensis]|uniref:Mannosyl-glycoprotein endo-beta-N-acetylglucosaminidase n=1 Tax=Dracunculus medinensis TaxID=318479 RepID=A0A158Q4Y4_DRAME|nr:unnamed protein product [Dracunculus medinensis]